MSASKWASVDQEPNASTNRAHSNVSVPLIIKVSCGEGED